MANDTLMMRFGVDDRAFKEGMESASKTTKKFAETTGQMGKGISSLGGDFGRLVGEGGPIGQFTKGLSGIVEQFAFFGVGGALVAGVGIGLAAIGSHFLKLKENIKKQREETEDAIKKLKELERAEAVAVLGAPVIDVEEQQKKVDGLKKILDKARADLAKAKDDERISQESARRMGVRPEYGTTDDETQAVALAQGNYDAQLALLKKLESKKSQFLVEAAEKEKQEQDKINQKKIEADAAQATKRLAAWEKEEAEIARAKEEQARKSADYERWQMGQETEGMKTSVAIHDWWAKSRIETAKRVKDYESDRIKAADDDEEELTKNRIERMRDIEAMQKDMVEGSVSSQLASFADAVTNIGTLQDQMHEALTANDRERFESLQNQQALLRSSLEGITGDLVGFGLTSVKEYIQLQKQISDELEAGNLEHVASLHKQEETFLQGMLAKFLVYLGEKAAGEGTILVARGLAEAALGNPGGVVAAAIGGALVAGGIGAVAVGTFMTPSTIEREASRDRSESRAPSRVEGPGTNAASSTTITNYYFSGPVFGNHDDASRAVARMNQRGLALGVR